MPRTTYIVESPGGLRLEADRETVEELEATGCRVTAITEGDT